MISIQSSRLRVLRDPAPQIAPTTLSGNQTHNTLTRAVGATGEVTFSGRPGDSGAGWSVGFMQAVVVEQDWRLFRGTTPEKGSTLLQFGAPPALPTPACWDGVRAGSLYYNDLDDMGAPGPGALTLANRPNFPLVVKVVHFDKPDVNTGLGVPNNLTNTGNYLEESRITLRFVTVLAVRGPGGFLRFLRGFYWRCDWHDRVRWPDSGNNITVLPREEADISVLGRQFEGPPSDPLLLNALTRPQPFSCTDLLASGSTESSARYKKDWSPFDTSR